jgi:sugar phosphate isomerase/epimerase
MRLGYVLPEPGSYRRWEDFDSDLACISRCGYDAVELQITDPAAFDEARVQRSLEAAGLPLAAFQTGGSYAARGNCLCSRDAAVRARTVSLLRSFVDLAARREALMVFGSLQGRLGDEPDRETGRKRIVQALGEVCAYASREGVVVAIEPVNHLEVGWHHTIAETAALVRALGLQAARLMIDTFHMNIEERDMVSALPGIADILVHVHLSETNRGVTGEGHLDIGGFLRALRGSGYAGTCSVGVFESPLPRQECIARSLSVIRRVLA